MLVQCQSNWKPDSDPKCNPQCARNCSQRFLPDKWGGYTACTDANFSSCTDSTTYLQNWLNALSSYSTAVLPAGLYKISSTLTAGTGFISTFSGCSTTGVTPSTTTTVNGSANVTVSSTSGISVGYFVLGPGIQAGAYVTNISGTTITLSSTATKSATSSINFYNELVTCSSAPFGSGSIGGHSVVGMDISVGGTCNVPAMTVTGYVSSTQVDMSASFPVCTGYFAAWQCLYSLDGQWIHYQGKRRGT